MREWLRAQGKFLRRNWWRVAIVTGFGGLTTILVVGILQGHSLSKFAQITYVLLANATVMWNSLRGAR